MTVNYKIWKFLNDYRIIPSISRYFKSKMFQNRCSSFHSQPKLFISIYFLSFQVHNKHFALRAFLYYACRGHSVPPSAGSTLMASRLYPRASWIFFSFSPKRSRLPMVYKIASEYFAVTAKGFPSGAKMPGDAWRGARARGSVAQWAVSSEFYFWRVCFIAIVCKMRIIQALGASPNRGIVRRVI